MTHDDAVAAVRQSKQVNKSNRKRHHSVLDDPNHETEVSSHSVTQPNKINERYTILLKDGVTTATIYPISSPLDIPVGLLHFLCDEYNMEIERGETLPFFDPLTLDQFVDHWFASFVGIMCLGDDPVLNGKQDEKSWENECLGIFSIKPNYPGRRCSHICTAEFLVNAGIRGKGIGRTLTDCFLQWAPKLGYTYATFNLVFESNAAARKLWESLNFKRAGKIKSAAYVKNFDQPVDAIIYGRELADKTVAESSAYRFDKIKYYLETGKYPATADRQEKARLRAGAMHYSLSNGKLMLKGKEVVSDSDQQLRICFDLHRNNGHLGINKTTTQVAEKYHWPRIKETVGVVIKECEKCNRLQKGVGDDNNGGQVGFELAQLDSDRPQISEYIQAVVSEVQQVHREGYRQTYAEVAASSGPSLPIADSYLSDEDTESDIIRPRVRTYERR
ncbi:SPT10 [Candida margitis]|uniref:SPT10 n=1 Tax=Candida margitis TaxID=1775924 RepID=UPI002227F5F0|nr:SPT10 [Candida margitis]KAI5969594.1 SPT10 [Candida margitis]